MVHYYLIVRGLAFQYKILKYQLLDLHSFSQVETETLLLHDDPVNLFYHYIYPIASYYLFRLS